MYLYTKEGRKEHIYIQEGRHIVAGQLILSSKHKTGAVATDSAYVIVRSVPKAHSTASTELVKQRLNIASTETNPVVTVIDFPFTSDEHIGITIEIVDTDKTLKSVSDVHLGWTSMPVIEGGALNSSPIS